MKEFVISIGRSDAAEPDDGQPRRLARARSCPAGLRSPSARAPLIVPIRSSSAALYSGNRSRRNCNSCQMLRSGLEHRPSVPIATTPPRAASSRQG